MPLIDAARIYGEAVAEVTETGERLLAMGIIHRPRRRQVEGVDLAGVRHPDAHASVEPSWGRRTWQAVQSPKVTSLGWAVTDRRLLLLDNYRIDPQRFRLHFAVPRSAIRAVRRRSRPLLGMGRVELTFVDGSMVALVLAIVDVTAATAFVRSLGSR
jgi:hypothetical protein